uniref:Uncharacterized protein n=1 Tax=Arcella intermedia TaxID=1963864 RepID=A0A6B2LL37_9EUKA
MDFFWKILILGDKGIGKTSLLERYITKSFPEDGPTPYRGKESKTTTLSLDEKKIKLEIWDPSTPNLAFYRGAHGLIMTYDCGNKATLEPLTTRAAEMEKYKPLNSLPKAIVGLKKDVADTVTEEDVKEWIAKNKVTGEDWIQVKVCTKTGEGVEELFAELIKKVKVSAEDGEN